MGHANETELFLLKFHQRLLTMGLLITCIIRYYLPSFSY
ncbi:hypothetical protein EDC48_11313 [Gibbsiella quercinecans]|nr:hypothetical protein EDC48_11313 [Gibbsiella quercinecans]